MKVERIALHNIKSFADFETAFGSGVNFICGRNGAGKSTLVEAIGLTLFGAGADGPAQEYFLRHGAKEGTIETTFSHNGERYIVKKRFRASGPTPRRVFDEEGAELDLHGEKDVDAFIREKLGLDTAVPLERLFNEVVGARQGTLTQPFLDTPNERKIKFNTMLGVERYKKAAKRLPALQAHVQQKEQQIAARLEVGQARSEGLEADREALTETTALLQQRQTQVQQQQNALQALSERLAALQKKDRQRAALTLQLAKEQEGLRADRENSARRQTELAQEQHRLEQELQTQTGTLQLLEDRYRQARQQAQTAQQALEAFDPHAAAAPLEERGKEMAAQYRVAQADLRRLEQNAAAARDGRCPFLDIPCTSVDGSLCDALSRRRTELQTRLTRGRSQMEALRKQVDDTNRQQLQKQAQLREIAKQAAQTDRSSYGDYTKAQAVLQAARRKMDACREQQTRLQQLQDAFPDREAALQTLQQQVAKLTEETNPAWLEQARAEQMQTGSRLSALQEQCSGLMREQERLQQQIRQKEQIRQTLEALQTERRQVQAVGELCKAYAQLLGSAGERVAVFYREQLGEAAQSIYQAISGHSVQLRWTEDYDVELTDVYLGQTRVRRFRQLSGGEQMSAALALRLSLLSRLSTANIAFFDEPTANLDAAHRENLSEALPKATRGFEQVFVISHDDTFDALSDTIINLDAEG